jgi:Uma2 family endonuclease
MSAPAPKLATYADLVAAPEHLIAEILDGRLVTRRHMPPLHNMAHSALLRALDRPLGHRRGHPGTWIFMSKPEVHLGPHVIVPDLAGWCRARLPFVPDVPWMELMPDWICEVISPSTAAEDRNRKRHIYAAHGLQHYWLLDPAGRRIETFDLGLDQCVLRGAFSDDLDVVALPFTEVPFPLATLWQNNTTT